MELKKTTILSAMVAVAGFLAEIIFHETMSQTVTGVFLSVLLAAVVLTAVYFVIDGVVSMAAAEKEKTEKAKLAANQAQDDFKQKIYSVINELLQFQKAVYKEICTMQSDKKESIHSKLQTESVNALREDMSIVPEQMQAMQEQITAIPEQMSALQDNLSAVRQTVGGVPEDMNALREELSVVPEGVNALREELSGVPEGVNALREELSAMPEDMNALREELSVVPEGVNALRAEMASVPEGVSLLQNDLNAVTESIEALRSQLAAMAQAGESKPGGITPESLLKLETSINENTMKTAKVIAKYITKSNDELRELLEKEE
ncbi:MAG: hypothetical protein LUH14_09800 [Clostridiaceae bacterium]|nr:hypothetical protein [Clostridiaceae bacterium]